MSKITKVILVALIIGLTIGTGVSVYNGYADERIIHGKYNASITITTGADGKIVNYIRPPIYGTQDFESYRAERIAYLKDSASKNPETVGWTTISFNPSISTGQLEMLKNKYSLKLTDIMGEASGTFQNDTGKGAGGVAVNVQAMGEKLEWFSKVYYVIARAPTKDLGSLSEEPNVILVDLNTDAELHESVFVPNEK